jgi:hypothetical protein
MYQEQARRHGQDISTTTDDATFAGGLRHITSVLPSLMNDILQHAPDSQKVCFLKPYKEKHLEEMQTKLQSINWFCCNSFYVFSFTPYILVDGKLSVNCRKR